MKGLVGWFVHRPLVVRLISVFVLVAGVAASQLLTYQTFPPVELGIFTVTTVRPGSSPEDMELSVTAPLEDEILEIEGIAKLESASMEAVSVITIRADPGLAESGRFLPSLRNAVDDADLPTDLPEEPEIEEMSTVRVPVMEVHVVGHVSEGELRRAARMLQDGLREIGGIASVDRVGYRDREVRILLHPDRIHRLRIALSEIREAIIRRNLRDAGGSIESFTTQQEVLTIGQFDDPLDVGQVIVRARAPGDFVRLDDIADIRLDYEDWEIRSTVDGQPAITLLPRKHAHADGLDTSAAVHRFLADQRALLPPGVEVVVTNDMSRWTTVMLDVLVSNALFGFALVIVILLLFYPAPVAGWIAFGLPVAFALAVALLPAVGLGIDVMTLTAMILLLGMLVDDAIVTGDSIIRMRERGLDPAAASIEGSVQVASPVIVSMATTILAFTPVAFMGGLEGKFLWALPVMAALTLGASLIECRLLLPTHLAHLRGRPRHRRWFDRVQRFYDRLVLRAVRLRYLTIAAFLVAALVAAGLGATVLRFNLYPEVNIDSFWVRVEMPLGSNFEHTAAALPPLEAMIREEVPAADLLSITAQIGHHDTDVYGSTEGRRDSWALITVHMRGESERMVNSNDVIARLRQRMAALDGYLSLVIEPFNDAPVIGQPVQVEVIGNDPSRFALADRLVAFLETQPGITDVWTSHQLGKDAVRVQLDHDVMAARGVTVADVIETVRMAFEGLIVGELRTLDETVDYRVQLAEEAAGQLAALESLTVLNDQGQPVPLRALARFELEPGEAAIRRYFGTRAVTVFGEIDRLVTDPTTINAALAAHVAEAGLLPAHPGLRLWYGGELEQQQEALGNIGVAFLMCLIGIAFLLIMLFNSASQPLLVMAVIPFAFVGVVLAFVVQGLEMSILALTGILGLTGVAVNDSLVMLDSLNRRRREAGDKLDAEGVAAGAGERLRAVVITSATTVAALFPAAYGLGGAHSFMTPMVMVMLWGVATATVVTLVLLPCLYAADQDVRRWLGAAGTHLRRRLHPARSR